MTKLFHVKQAVCDRGCQIRLQEGSRQLVKSVKYHAAELSTAVSQGQVNVCCSWSHASRLALLLPPLGQRPPPCRCILLVLAAAVPLLLLLLVLSLLILIILSSSGSAILLLIQLPPPAQRSKEAAAGVQQIGEACMPRHAGTACYAAGHVIITFPPTTTHPFTCQPPFTLPPTRTPPVPRLLRRLPLALGRLLPLTHLGHNLRPQLLTLHKKEGQREGHGLGQGCWPHSVLGGGGQEVRDSSAALQYSAPARHLCPAPWSACPAPAPAPCAAPWPAGPAAPAAPGARPATLTPAPPPPAAVPPPGAPEGCPPAAGRRQHGSWWAVVLPTSQQSKTELPAGAPVCPAGMLGMAGEQSSTEV